MLSPEDFFASVSGFYQAAGTDKILAVAWYLHVHGSKETFTRDDIRACFRNGNVEPPDISVYLPRLEARKPSPFLKSRQGYRLEGGLRRRLDAIYSEAPHVKVVAALLGKLPDSVPNIAERDFLREALSCYRVGAFRAATVMAWNLAFDHFCDWIAGDTKRLGDFRAACSAKFPKKTPPGNRSDLEDLKESEIIEIARTAKLISKNTQSILSEKLKRRNMAAHPSAVKIEQSQADDTIVDLINNVVLILN